MLYIGNLLRGHRGDVCHADGLYCPNSLCIGCPMRGHRRDPFSNTAGIRHCSSLSHFKTSLKTFLYTSATLSYSNPFTGTDALLDFMLILLLMSSLAD